MSKLKAVALAFSLAVFAISVAPLTVVRTSGATEPRTLTAATRTCDLPTPGHVTCFAIVKHAVQPTNQSASPKVTIPTGLSPQAISTAYGFPPNGGAGETIAVVDAYNDPTATANLATFSQTYALPSCTAANGCFVKTTTTGGSNYPPTTNRWALEISLDIEWAHAVAPDAQILLVEAGSTGNTDMFAAVRFAAQRAKYVSMSWGTTEFIGETGFDSVFTSNPGVSFFAAAGDGIPQVIYPSVSPDVVSVGGTTLSVTPSTHAWQAETAWTSAGGGCSLYESAAAAQRAYASYDQSGANCAGARSTPDVSLDANPTTGVSVYDTVGVGGGWFTIGGTSASTVMVAARAAATGTSVGAGYLYGGNARIYNVTTGSNGHPCETGYNLCTGLGSWNTEVGNSMSSGTLSITTAPHSVTAGHPSTSFMVNLSQPAPAGGLQVALAATSGGLSTSPSGPYASSTTFAIAASQVSTPGLYFEGTVAGTSILTASASGWHSSTASLQIDPGPLALVVISPASASVPEGKSQTFTASGYDIYDNVVGVIPTWSVPSSAGTIAPLGSSAAFTAGTTPVVATVSATVGTVSGAASVTVTGLNSMKVALSDSPATKTGHSFRLSLPVVAQSSTGFISGAKVALRVYPGSLCSGTAISTYSGSTGLAGTAKFTFVTSEVGTYCASAVVTAATYRTGVSSLLFALNPVSKRFRLMRF